MASGDIIGILNSDDFYTSNNILSQVVENIGELDAVYGDIHYVNDGDLTKMVRYYSSSFFKPWMMRLGFMPAHPSFYCRKSIYQKYGLFDTSFKVAADFEQLLRLIFINRISIKYLPIDFVTMRTGGASSSGMTSHKSIIKDHMLAYKKNGVYSNYLLEGMRYLYKILEITKYKLLRI
jgi:glycosyltransferase involved in cell wall biosynthesis